MKKTKLILFLSIFILISCESKKENFELTFFRWSIHEDYFLKINSSDTIYLIVDNPIEKSTKFAVIKENEKVKLDKMISELNFPNEEDYSRDVNDGLSYVFVYRKNNLKKKLSIHANAGPAKFWEFGRLLEEIKNTNEFIEINRKIDLKDIMDLMTVPLAPPIVPEKNNGS